MTISASTPLRVVVLLTSIALALLLLLAGSVAAGTAPVTVDAVAASVEHRVEAGDTLWSIAAGHTPPGEDVRATIHDIKAANELESSVIAVGQVLVIPGS